MSINRLSRWVKDFLECLLPWPIQHELLGLMRRLGNLVLRLHHFGFWLDQLGFFLGLLFLRVGLILGTDVAVGVRAWAQAARWLSLASRTMSLASGASSSSAGRGLIAGCSMSAGSGNSGGRCRLVDSSDAFQIENHRALRCVGLALAGRWQANVIFWARESTVHTRSITSCAGGRRWSWASRKTATVSRRNLDR